MLTLGEQDQFGLWLNLDREYARKALPTALGISMAVGGEMDANLMRAFTNNEAEAKLAAFRRKRANV